MPTLFCFFLPPTTMRVWSSLLFASVKPFSGYHLLVVPQIWRTHSKSCEGLPFPQPSPIEARLQRDRSYTWMPLIIRAPRVAGCCSTRG